MSNRPHTVTDCYLTLDQGGHSSRALVFDHLGQLIASAQCPVDTRFITPDRAEQDSQELLDSLRTAAADVLQQLDDATRRRLVSAGLATQRSSIVCWNRKTGKALSPVISWQDRRANKWLKQFAPQREAVHKITGLYLSAHYGASKIRWCLENIDAVKQALAKEELVIGPLAAFLVRNLLVDGEDCVDPANASRMLLWNLSRREWDQHLLELFGIPQTILPRSVHSRHAFGTFDIGGKRLPMELVTGDQSAAIFAMGELQPDTAYINVGTGAFLSRSSGHTPIYGRRLLSSIVLQEDGDSTYVLEGTVNGAASALDWLEHELQIENVVPQLPDWLKQVENPPLFLNGVSGLGAPFWVADFKSRFVGEGDVSAKAVAVIESICFLLMINLQEMKKLSSPPLQIQITGGLSALEGMCQKMADLSRLPVYRPTDHEATARGVAYLLAGCPAHWPEEGSGDWFKPKSNPQLSSRYEQWLEALLADIRDD